ncbi:hypothetical protein AVEN_10266-1 [Araneus ventricosus]|uniref:RNase H type-1 domain-containing protein n=1 Tax=Araneus ventricosus TaxID=182803 RepID=A0A4Y2KVV7_ARAVE|nr:hypothetical protein AVEN_10266-1 [Araneus ventricosus]
MTRIEPELAIPSPNFRTTPDCKFMRYTRTDLESKMRLDSSYVFSKINIQNYLFKLNTFNSVFQAELAAIEFAVNWAVKEKVKVNIHTDSLSSISAINSANTRPEFVNKVKSNIFKAKNIVGLSWVKAHVGIPGNELADQQTKLAITFVGMIHPPSYLHRFKFLDSPHCIYGMLDDADHYIFSCSLTKEFHLIKPADEHKKAWFNNLLKNRQAVTKMEGAFRTSRNICDTLTQEREKITDSNDVLRVRVTSILSY